MKRILPIFLAMAFAAASASADPLYYEWRTYTFASEEKAGVFDKTVAEALIPALGRIGIGPVGVWKPREAKDEDKGAVIRHVLVPHKSLDELVTTDAKLAEDEAFTAAAADYLMVGQKNAVFTRIQSTLLVAARKFPEVRKPAALADPSPRFFEVRIYESPSEVKGHLKVRMFNRGEFDIFDAVGLNTVWFGQAIAGEKLPQLTYMLAYDSEEKRKAAWDGFLSAPAWKELKADEQYKETVSKIHSRYLLAMPFSQIK